MTKDEAWSQAVEMLRLVGIPDAETQGQRLSRTRCPAGRRSG